MQTGNTTHTGKQKQKNKKNTANDAIQKFLEKHKWNDFLESLHAFLNQISCDYGYISTENPGMISQLAYAFAKKNIGIKSKLYKVWKIFFFVCLFFFSNNTHPKTKINTQTLIQKKHKHTHKKSELEKSPDPIFVHASNHNNNSNNTIKDDKKEKENDDYDSDNDNENENENENGNGNVNNNNNNQNNAINLKTNNENKNNTENNNDHIYVGNIIEIMIANEWKEGVIAAIQSSVVVVC